MTAQTLPVPRPTVPNACTSPQHGNPRRATGAGASPCNSATHEQMSKMYIDTPPIAHAHARDAKSGRGGRPDGRRDLMDGFGSWRRRSCGGAGQPSVAAWSLVGVERSGSCDVTDAIEVGACRERGAGREMSVIGVAEAPGFRGLQRRHSLRARGAQR